MSSRFSAVMLRIVVGCAVVAVLDSGAAKAQYGHGSIVGWGGQVFGGNLSADFVAVAGGGHHSLGIKGCILGNLNCDGCVDHADLGLLLGHWGEGCP